jgi:hypothetical protein
MCLSKCNVRRYVVVEIVREIVETLVETLMETHAIANAPSLYRRMVIAVGLCRLNQVDP